MKRKSELRKNVDAYSAMESELLKTHKGEIAMFSNGELVSFHKEKSEAYYSGISRFGEGRFSVKTIGEAPATLGTATLYAHPVKVK